MPGRERLVALDVPGIHVLSSTKEKDVDGRDKPGHDARRGIDQICRSILLRWKRLRETTMTQTRKTIELIHEGGYAAEVEIELEYTDESWSPTMSGNDARKLETVMLALRRGDTVEASKYGRVFALMPVAAE